MNPKTLALLSIGTVVIVCVATLYQIPTLNVSQNYKRLLIVAILGGTVAALLYVKQTVPVSASRRAALLSSNEQLVLALYTALRGARPVSFAEYSKILANNFNTSPRLGTFATYQRFAGKHGKITMDEIRAQMH